ncbi:MAG: hypothetical protein ACOCP8_04150 [archaeon]
MLGEYYEICATKDLEVVEKVLEIFEEIYENNKYGVFDTEIKKDPPKFRVIYIPQDETYLIEGQGGFYI